MLPITCKSSERHCTRQRGVHTVEERMLSQRAQQQIPLRLSNYDPGFNSEAVFIQRHLQRHREAKRRRYSARTSERRKAIHAFVSRPRAKILRQSHCPDRPTLTPRQRRRSRSVGALKPRNQGGTRTQVPCPTEVPPHFDLEAQKLG